MKRFALSLATCLLAVAPAAAASPDPKDLNIPPQEISKAKALVKKLGSESYKEREEATDELGKMGRLAMPVLQEAASSDSNPEIRFRVVRLLPRAEAADLQARIDTFLADVDGKFEHSLPAWKLFRKELGDDKPARELYVDLLKSQSNLEVLLALETSSQAGGRAVSDRRTALYLQMNPQAFGRFNGTNVQPKQPSLGDLTTVLLGEIVVPNKDIPRGGPFFMNISGAMILQQTPTGMNAARNPDGTPLGKPFLRVMVRWFDTRNSPDDLAQVSYLAQQFPTIKETTPLLRRVVTTDGVQQYARAQAMMFLVQRGGKDEIPTIKTQLANDQSLNGRIQIAPNVIIECQLRDVALALLVHLTGQDLKSYGYEFQQGFAPANVVNNYWGYGFVDDDKRKAAHQKWEKWEAEQKDKKPEPKK